MTVGADAYVWGAAGSQVRVGGGKVLNSTALTKLTWAPPDTTGYTTYTIPETGAITHTLDDATNYVVELPTTGPRTDPLLIRGGNNIVIIGGEIKIDDIVYNANGGASEADQNGIRFQDTLSSTAGRIVHMEGVLIHGYGLSDGVRTANHDGSDPTDSIDLRLQNCRIELGMWYRDSTLDGTGTPHPDILQPYGGIGHLRVDGLTGLVTGQGLMLKPDYGSPNPGFMQLKRLNLRENTASNIEYNDPNATWPNPGRDPRYLWWTNGGEGGVRVEKGSVWINHPTRTFAGDKVFWPEGGTQGDDATGHYLLPTHAVGWDGTGSGYVYEGNPPDGDYVPSGTPGVGVPGIGYETPGYV